MMDNKDKDTNPEDPDKDTDEDTAKDSGKIKYTDAYTIHQRGGDEEKVNTNEDTKNRQLHTLITYLTYQTLS